MFNISYIIKKKDLFPSVLGVSYYHFEKLLPKFSSALRLKEYARIPDDKRKRKPGAGRKSNLGDDTGKLFFILFYYRHYPTLRLAQALFSCEDSHIHYWIYFLTSVLWEALGYQLTLPKVRVNSIQGIYQTCPDLKEFIVDGTEREIERPKDKTKQKDYYSGKKKEHTVKNQVIISPRKKKILYVSKTITGRVHDKKALIDDGILTMAPVKSKGLGDLGYQGTTEDCPWLNVATPLKRKPKQELSQADKETNKSLSSLRVKVEHVIGKLKIDKILCHPFRSNIDFADQVFKNICCLYNFKLAYRYPYVGKRR
jgi:hypothetical protein